MPTSPKLPPVTGLSDLVKPNYSPGLMLQDDDLNQAVDYTRDLSRLVLKSLLGSGVIGGFELSRVGDGASQALSIEPGLALDAQGDPVQLSSELRIALDIGQPAQFWVVIRRSEIGCLRRDLACDDDDDDRAAVFTRTRDGYQIRFATELPGLDEVGVVLARVTLAIEGGAIGNVEIDHSARHYIRPQLAPDPAVPPVQAPH